MRIGVVALRGEAVAHRVSQPMGYGTSNQAELLAVREALRWAPKDEPVELHVDSKYVCGVISRGWNVFKNTELVAENTGTLQVASRDQNGEGQGPRRRPGQRVGRSGCGAT